MRELTPELRAIGLELTRAVERRVASRSRTRRRARIAVAVMTAFGAFAAAAVAAGVGDDLQLDPTKWNVFERGSVADGKAEYAKARAVDGSSDATFMVEHDDGLGRYEAFVLHEQVVAAAGGGREQGALCSPAELRHAETTALATVRANFAAGTSADVTRATVNAALADEFADDRCRGLDYAGERARFVFADIEPPSMLMPGVE